MELTEAMRTMNACRWYRPDPVPDEVFYRAVKAARFAPQGDNRQAVRFIIVRDPEKKRRLGEWYLPPWREAYDAAKAGLRSVTTQSGVEPVIVVVCVDPRETHPTDTELGRLSIVGGESVYPMAQNFCLALRDQGVATTFTTLLVAYEPQVRELLEIPGDFITACHIVAGYPARGFPTRLRRRPVEEIAFVDTFGVPLTLGDAPAA